MWTPWPCASLARIPKALAVALPRCTWTTSDWARWTSPATSPWWRFRDPWFSSSWRCSMATVPTFEELFRDCRESAVHLEMRDSCMRADPAYVDWAAGVAIDPAERWADWLTLVSEATSRG